MIPIIPAPTMNPPSHTPSHMMRYGNHPIIVRPSSDPQPDNRLALTPTQDQPRPRNPAQTKKRAASSSSARLHATLAALGSLAKGHASIIARTLRRHKLRRRCGDRFCRLRLAEDSEFGHFAPPGLATSCRFRHLTAVGGNQRLPVGSSVNRSGGQRWCQADATVTRLVSG